MNYQYLTKSRFKLALECPTKLYYGTRFNDYADQNIDDAFLIALAEGGYQVGELAKYLFSNDPITDDITIEELDYDIALTKTELKRNAGGRVVIAEAAFKYENLFIRTDLIVEENNRIDLYEVKAKSWDNTVEFLKTIKKGERKGEIKIDPNWQPYLYDIAFQKYVIEKSNPGKKVFAHIVLANKTQEATIDGLNQLFKINRVNNRVQIKVQDGLTKNDLGIIPLKVVNVDPVCDWVYSNPVKIDLEYELMFEELVDFLSNKFAQNERIWSNCLGKKCKDCQFFNPNYPQGQRSGFHECWKQIAKLDDEDLTQPLILELWGGKTGATSIVGNAINQGVYKLSNATESLYLTDSRVTPEGDTLDATKRRTVQITKSRNQDFSPYIDIQGLTELFEVLPAPYHFIDFETTAVALPFHSGRKPYEAIAFQYSYHIMDELGNIRHQNQYLSFEKGVFPNYDFLRSLRNDLSGVHGTIFRYHQHENSYLNHLYKQLIREDLSTVEDKEDLMAFIREISTPTNDNPDRWEPTNNMVDLYELVLSYFYSLYAKGSNSIKDILPAVIKSSEYIRTKYSQPVYATPQIPSLNFAEPHIWIQEEKGLNPYKTLPDLFSDIDKVRFDISDSSIMELNNGGAAMTAYAYLQFTDMPAEQRELYKEGLLRYCELDTMAMIMIWEYWRNLIGK
jgi:hypothetical protein